MSETTSETQKLLDEYVEQEGMIKSQYANASGELKRQYDQSLATVDQSRQGSRQAASISLDKLKKYLPEQLAAQGLGNLGVSQTAYIRAQNNYQNQLAGIESDANAKRTELYNSYANNRSALEQQKTRDLLDLYSKRDAAIYQAERDAIGDARYEDEQTKADQLAFYNNLAAMIDSGVFGSMKDLNNYLNADTDKDGISDVYGNLDDSYKSLIDGKVAGYQKTLDEKAQAELFQNVKNVLEEGVFNTVGDLEKYLYTDSNPDDNVGSIYDRLGENEKAYVRQVIDTYKGDPDMMAADKAYNEMYERDENGNLVLKAEVRPSEIYFNVRGSSITDDEGDDFSVFDENGVYRVESSGKVDAELSETIKKAAQEANIGLDQVFGYNGELYIMHQGEVYGIRRRNAAREDHFNEIYNSVFSVKPKK